MWRGFTPPHGKMDSPLQSHSEVISSLQNQTETLPSASHKFAKILKDRMTEHESFHFALGRVVPGCNLGGTQRDTPFRP